jgi:hypothetical protein
MSILNRLTKLEKDNPNEPPCFCNRTLLDLWYGKPGFSGLTYCADCKDQFDYWQNLARDARTSKNLTDGEL